MQHLTTYRRGPYNHDMIMLLQRQFILPSRYVSVQHTCASMHDRRHGDVNSARTRVCVCVCIYIYIVRMCI